MLDRDQIVRDHDRRLKIRALRRFEAERVSMRQLEREFAREALDMLRRQPAMAEAAGLRNDVLAWPAMAGPATRRAELPLDC